MIEWSIVRYELSVADKFEQFVGYFCKAWLPPTVIFCPCRGLLSHGSARYTIPDFGTQKIQSRTPEFDSLCRSGRETRAGVDVVGSILLPSRGN